MTRQEHLLTILAEECAEVAQVAAKALRFGLADAQPGQFLTNSMRLRAELHDLMAVVEMLTAEGCEIEPTSRDSIDHKKAKVELYLRYSAERGTLSA